MGFCAHPLEIGIRISGKIKRKNLPGKYFKLALLVMLKEDFCPSPRNEPQGYLLTTHKL